MAKINELVLEFRYPPNALVLDRRGEWAETLSLELDLKEWAIDENSVRIFNKEGSRSLLVSFRNAALSVRDIETKKNKARRLGWVQAA